MKELVGTQEEANRFIACIIQMQKQEHITTHYFKVKEIT